MWPKVAATDCFNSMALIVSQNQPKCCPSHGIAFSRAISGSAAAAASSGDEEVGKTLIAHLGELASDKADVKQPFQCGNSLQLECEAIAHINCEVPVAGSAESGPRRMCSAGGAKRALSHRRTVSHVTYCAQHQQRGASGVSSAGVIFGTALD